MPPSDPTNQQDEPSSAVTAQALSIFEQLARRFPVCLYSDEFHFFPQARANTHDWRVWDDFSAASVRALTEASQRWQGQLAAAAKAAAAVDDCIDTARLARALRTLTEQLNDIAPQRRQPTFHLTIAAIGLAEALEHGTDAWHQRAAALPEFIDRAVASLEHIPRLFRDMGLEMAGMLIGWLQGLHRSGMHATAGCEALTRMEDHLRHVSTQEAFLLPLEHYETVTADHVGCSMPLAEITGILDEEIRETRCLLETAAAHLAPGEKWPTVLAALPSPGADQDGAAYQTLIDDLGRHCADVGLMHRSILKDCPVRVARVPAHLTPVRSSAAYSMPPGHPSRGGTFYTMDDAGGRPSDWRLLSAHETYPGHHLLDVHRWNHPRPARRHMEFPLFYEGWASFSEELLFDTGFFSDSWEARLLMAKRRFWRAMRGRADVYLHSGQKTLDQAAGFLADAGMPKVRADAMVRRYALKPGYQICYTMGRITFRNLYDRYRRRGGAPATFVRCVLTQGQIGLDDLADRLFPTP